MSELLLEDERTPVRAMRSHIDSDPTRKETPGLVINTKKYKAALIPPALIVVRYFAKEQAAIDELQAAKDALSQELEAFIEEHSGDEGILENAKTDKGKVTKVSIKARIKADS